MSNSSHNLANVEAALDAMRRAMVGARERLGEGLQLTRTQVEILTMLIEKPQTTGELARRLFLTQSAVTQTVDTLVRRSLIDRHPDDHDRRVIQLRLSPTGLNITNHLRSLRRKHMQALVDRLTQNEVEVLISVTEKLTAQLNETKTTPTEI